MPSYHPPDSLDTIRRALAEDIGTGDVTTLFTVDADARAETRFASMKVRRMPVCNLTIELARTCSDQ